MWCRDMSRLQKAKCSIGWLFFLLGSTIGNWSALIPSILKSHDINEAVLGGILTCAIAGAVLAAPASTFCIRRYGSGFSSICGSLLLVCVAIVLGVPGELWLLAIALTLLGFGMGWTDVSINSQAMLCEKLGGKSTIGFFHASYALGALFGVLYGGSLLQIDVSILNIFMYFAAIAIIPTISLRIWLFTKGEEKIINDNNKEKLSEIETFMGKSSPIADETQFEKMDNGSIIGVCSADEGDEEKSFYEMNCNATLASREASVSSNDEESANSAIEDGKSIDMEFPGPWSCHLSSGGISIDSAESQRRNSNPEVMFENPSSAKSQREKNAIDYWVLFLLCSLGGLAYTGEGSIGDWSTVYLVIELKTSPIIGVLGFAVFQFIVCFGRYSSDTIVEYVDRKLLLQISGGLASLGLGVVGLSQSLPTAYIVPCAIIGFGICGAGLSVVSPIVIYYAGTSIKGLQPDQAIAYVSSVSYLGVLIGPPLFGALAEALKGLRWSLLVDGGIMFFILFLACFLPSKSKKTAETLPI